MPHTLQPVASTAPPSVVLTTAVSIPVVTAGVLTSGAPASVVQLAPAAVLQPSSGTSTAMQVDPTLVSTPAVALAMMTRAAKRNAPATAAPNALHLDKRSRAHFLNTLLS